MHALVRAWDLSSFRSVPCAGPCGAANGSDCLLNDVSNSLTRFFAVRNFAAIMVPARQ